MKVLRENCGFHPE